MGALECLASALAVFVTPPAYGPARDAEPFCHHTIGDTLPKQRDSLLTRFVVVHECELGETFALTDGIEGVFTATSEDLQLLCGLRSEGEVPWVGFEPTLSVV